MKPLFILLMVSFSCNKKINTLPKSIAISVVADATDAISVSIKPEPILQLYQFEKQEGTEAIFRFKVIRDVKLTPTITHHIPSLGVAKNDSDPQYRKRAILQFYGSVKKELNDFTVNTTNAKGLPNSECYFAIAEELRYLTKNNFNRKVLIVCSNLFEKSFVDLYKHDMSSEDIARAFEKEHSLPSKLEGLHVYFVFSPRDRVEDERYAKVITAYRKILEYRGATVTVQATSEYYQI